MTDMTMQDAVLLVSDSRTKPAKAVAVVQPITEASVRRSIKTTEIKLVSYSLIKFFLICAFLASGWDLTAAYQSFPTFYMTAPMAVLVLIVSTTTFVGFQFITSQLESQLESDMNALTQFYD